MKEVRELVVIIMSIMGKRDNLLIGLLFIAPTMYAAVRNDSIETDSLKNIALNEVFVKAERGHIVKKKGNVKTFFFSRHGNETKDIYEALTEVPDLRIDPTMKTISLAEGGAPFSRRPTILSQNIMSATTMAILR